MKFIFNKILMSLCILGVFGVLKTQAQAPHENSEGTINYSSTMDAKNIYVHLGTTDEATMVSMLHGGFSIYFDVKGKRKKNVSVQYPSEVTAPQAMGNGSENARGTSGVRQEIEHEKRPDILAVLVGLSKMARYSTPDLVQEFHLDLNNLGISIAYDYDKDAGLLHYELIMPIKNITVNPIDVSKLTIGIVTTKIEKEQKESSNVSFGGRDQGGRGGQGGGPGGGGGRGGSQGGDRPDQDQRPEEVTIDFWFKADLSQ
ncbi:hypothetical protein I2486_19380 [Cellulophaga sp. E16_2]|uniref:Uncharacterized protein n=1 Tax=Cellulophaga algicola (strain DSM 14237 / IC166 / ACAM 630) TaxID=688270 RepID=E6XCB1_CELAD|nr:MULTISPECIES: hypothetical protein [Cellulophaga]ADV51164.1 hypothetical protein Celal_3920 [Cellulophaga algicola DSM 14237]MBO0593566.1 hypothetical protein [Cellulophaga sp. E16_2]